MNCVRVRASTLATIANATRTTMDLAANTGTNAQRIRTAVRRANASIRRAHRCRGVSATAIWAGTVRAAIRVSIHNQILYQISTITYPFASRIPKKPHTPRIRHQIDGHRFHPVPQPTTVARLSHPLAHPQGAEGNRNRHGRERHIVGGSRVASASVNRSLSQFPRHP